MRSIADLCGDLPISAFAPGDTLLPEGASTGKLYVLIDGIVEVVKSEVQITLVHDRGAIFGDMSVLLGAPHMATVRAVTPCTAYLAEGGETFLKSNPEITFFLAQILAQRLNGVTSYLVDLKKQFEDQANHLGMVDEILESLLHEQRNEFTPGSDRDPDMM